MSDLRAWTMEDNKYYLDMNLTSSETLPGGRGCEQLKTIFVEAQEDVETDESSNSLSLCDPPCKIIN